ncbi:SRPBCC family protein [Chitinophaga sp. 22321]|uniref:SRPBCC domain-containing protein n=1 Tax=Chitinophaga hostae TaxID=2831022 RepID=A0ABS5J729_9BACT|nr:SRPBCC domain-containing protein [Chitinophaga hostae]MBS0031024.1 SRPBCC domain-containing protein [Chitinophaga hostae]
MRTPDFTTTILVNQTPSEAFNAITDIRDWWSEEIEGGTHHLDDEFVYHYKDIHYCKMKLIELVPGKRVVWLVVDSYFNFTADKAEWSGTKIVFDISQKDAQTAVTFTHEGLVPQHECYEICREAWTHYITESLYSLITTGKGQPNPKESDGYNAELAGKWKLEQH